MWRPLQVWPFLLLGLTPARADPADDVLAMAIVAAGTRGARADRAPQFDWCNPHAHLARLRAEVCPHLQPQREHGVRLVHDEAGRLDVEAWRFRSPEDGERVRAMLVETFGGRTGAAEPVPEQADLCRIGVVWSSEVLWTYDFTYGVPSPALEPVRDALRAGGEPHLGVIGVHWSSCKVASGRAVGVDGAPVVVALAERSLSFAKVRDVAADDTLSVRDRPPESGSLGAVVATLEPGRVCLPVLSWSIDEPWWELAGENAPLGFASARYLELQPTSTCRR